VHEHSRGPASVRDHEVFVEEGIELFAKTIAELRFRDYSVRHAERVATSATSALSKKCSPCFEPYVQMYGGTFRIAPAHHSYDQPYG
jgi:hypothetical protein